MVDIARHKNGKSIQHVSRNGSVYLNCKDLFDLLGVNWNAKKVRKLQTVKAKVKDVSGRNQDQLFLLAEDSRRFLQKSKRTEKAMWVMTEFLKNDPMIKPKLRRDGLEKRVEALEKENDHLKTMNKALAETVKAQSIAGGGGQQEAAFLVREFDMPRRVRDFLIQQYEVGHVWEQRLQQNARERAQDEKECEIPDALHPNRWQKKPISIRWFEFEGVVWIHIDDFCNSMAYPRSFVKNPPRIHEQPWYAIHRTQRYINADVLRRHSKYYCRYQQKAERATWEHFRTVARQCAMSSSQNTSSST